MATRNSTRFFQTRRTAVIDPTKNSTSSSTSKTGGRASHHRSDSGGRPSWSMSPLIELLPESPSPICSGCSSLLSSTSSSPDSLKFFSKISPEFSASRNQSFFTLPLIPHIDVNEWMDHAQQHHDHSQNHRQDCSFKCYVSSSSTCENVVVGLPTPREREGSGSVREFSHEACKQSMCEPSEAGSVDDQQRKLMTRPKPYHAFLDEVKQQEIESDIDSWRKAEQTKLMDKLKRKEAAISDWESKQTSKVMQEMKKLKSDLEKKRAKLLEKKQKKINKTKAEANKKMVKARRATIDKISAISKISARARSTRSLTWIKLMRFF